MSVATPSTVPITNYSDFWLHYLREHSKPETRALHYFGTSAGIVLWLTALWTHTFTLVPIGLFIGKAAQITDAFLFLVQRSNYASSTCRLLLCLGRPLLCRAQQTCYIQVPRLVPLVRLCDVGLLDNWQFAATIAESWSKREQEALVMIFPTHTQDKD